MRTLFRFLFCLPLLFWGEELEVSLATQSKLPPLYLSRLHAPPSDYDWRYLDELRSVLEFDLQLNGCCTVQSIREEWEERLHWPDVRKEFDVAFWEKEHIPYLLTLQVSRNRLTLIAFDIEKGISKKFAEVVITGQIEKDRKALHLLSDAVTKDLFGVDGVASLRILYSYRTKPDDREWQSSIWISDADGARALPVIQDGSYAVSPGFFPKTGEEREFYYVSYKQGQSKIYRATLFQSEGVPMISLRGSQVLPSIAKEGKYLAFISDVAGRPDLFLQTLDKRGQLLGKARQIYSQPRATQASPTFSPDGKKIAFVSDKDGPPRIYVMDVPSAQSTRRQRPDLLTKKNRENTSPAWSPDGKKLAYSARSNGVRQIWLYDFATEEETQLTTGPGNKENPSWAPNSLHLVYNTEGEECELYVLHLAESRPICISKGPGQKRFPCWEPESTTQK